MRSREDELQPEYSQNQFSSIFMQTRRQQVRGTKMGTILWEVIVGVGELHKVKIQEPNTLQSIHTALRIIKELIIYLFSLYID